MKVSTTNKLKRTLDYFYLNKCDNIENVDG